MKMNESKDGAIDSFAGLSEQNELDLISESMIKCNSAISINSASTSVSVVNKKERNEDIEKLKNTVGAWRLLSFR